MKAVAAILLPTLSIICRTIPTASSFAAQSHRRSVVDFSASSRRGRRLRSPSLAAVAAAADPGPERGAAPPPPRPRHRNDDDDDDDDDVDEEEAAGSPHRPWATRALLFSSFDDGVSSNGAARSFLRHSLADALLRERAGAIEDGVRSSAAFSPCNGPDADAIGELERVDRMRERGRGVVVAGAGRPGGGGAGGLRDGSVDRWSTEALRLLMGGGGSTGTDPISGKREEEEEVPPSPPPPPPLARVLYVPTAMYAPDPRSSSTPGKQRQRARADGKKRRDKLLRLVEDLLTIDDDDRDDGRDDDRRRRRIGVLSTTLDLDDGSTRHNFGSDDASHFPRDGSAALSTWRPHLVYVEGGNTFWLRYCMGRGGPGPGGGYVGLVRDACAGPRGLAVYLGKSAGAIVAGRDVGTATWKGWDDPSVVPGRGAGGASDGDWSGYPGLDLAGGRSFFPHMSDDWADTVRERTREMTASASTTERRRDDDADDDGLVCLGERDALCVMGDERLLIMTSGTEPLN